MKEVRSHTSYTPTGVLTYPLDTHHSEPRSRQIWKYQYLDSRIGTYYTPNSRFFDATANGIQIFFACPHRYKNIQNLEEDIARLLSVDKTRRHYGLGFAKQLARSVAEINSEFLDTKLFLQARVYNIYSVQETPAAQVSRVPGESSRSCPLLPRQKLGFPNV